MRINLIMVWQRGETDEDTADLSNSDLLDSDRDGWNMAHRKYDNVEQPLGQGPDGEQSDSGSPSVCHLVRRGSRYDCQWPGDAEGTKLGAPSVRNRGRRWGFDWAGNISDESGHDSEFPLLCGYRIFSLPSQGARVFRQKRGHGCYGKSLALFNGDGEARGELPGAFSSCVASRRLMRICSEVLS